VSTIGTGTTGSAIGAVVSTGGNTVELFGQGDAARSLCSPALRCGRGHPGAAR
jgi:hypothetical protein